MLVSSADVAAIKANVSAYDAVPIEYTVALPYASSTPTDRPTVATVLNVDVSPSAS
jgi:hypothetical protein